MSIVERERVEEVVAPREVTEADVLERAADLLEEYGWCQGSYGSKTKGEFCANGAISAAVTDLLGRLDERLYTRTTSVNGTLWFLSFNDKRGRTKAEVVSALRTAAQKARES